ncbi:MAG TPA: PhzF family phenazine biosynthesis protein [Pseudonocardia sp.]|jgi:trans-2,3-dihydro-3-hydroxyanthranilate isomerase|nr:PhzF family phenazine biosynthesis protein [Pseudonocardia sp.]
MAALRFDVVDVFADRPFAGNPLAVVHGATGLETSQLQALAREFNLSETVFPLPATGSAGQAGADYRARIFTPASELPFAGHPSVGVAWVLGRDGVIGLGDAVQECGAGLLPVTVSASGARVYGGEPTLGPVLDAAALAAAAGLGPEDVDPGGPDGRAAAQPAGAGLEWTFLAVRADAVARATLPTSADLAGRAEGTGLAIVAFDPGERRAHVRTFAPAQGVPEDPATGSAAVALGVWLVSRGLLPADGVSEVTIAQGAEMGRPSRLDLRVEASGGRTVRTSVGGDVVPVSTGTIAIPPLP